MTTKIFLSYARVDGSFVSRLAAALDARGFVPIYDLAADPARDPTLLLTAQDEWWAQLQRMIAACDVFAFVVSPASAASPACEAEIAYAKSLGKRVVAILRERIDLASTPERLRALNIQLSFEDDGDEAFRRSMASLADELARDIEWYRRGANLVRLAQEWKSEGSLESHLLRTGAIEMATDWIARRPASAPAPSDLLLDFLAASREKEANDSRKLRESLARAYLKFAELMVAEESFRRATIVLATGLLHLDDRSDELIALFHDVVAAAAIHDRLVARDSLSDVAYCNAIALPNSGAWLLVNFATRGACYDPVRGFRETSKLDDYREKEFGGLFLCGVECDGKPYFGVSLRGEFVIYDMSTGSCIGTVPFCNPEKAKFATNMKYVAVLTHDNTLVLDKNLQVVSSLGAGRWSKIFEFSPSGARLFTSDYGRSAVLWESLRGVRKRYLREVDKTANCATFSRNSKWLAVGAEDGMVHLFRASDGKQITELTASQSAIQAMDFSRDNTKLAIIDACNQLSLWTWNTAQRHFEIEIPFYTSTYRLARLPQISQVAFIQDDTRIMTLLDGDALIWDASISRTIRSGSLPATAKLASGTHDDAAWLAAVDTNDSFVVHHIDDDGMRKVARIRCDTRTVTSLSFAPLVNIAASGHREGMLRFYDSASGRIIREITAGTDACAEVAFSPDGHICAAVGSDHAVTLWDWQVGSLISTCRGHHAHIVDVRFSEDGSKIATFNLDAELPDDRYGATNDNTVRIWDVATGECIDIKEFDSSLVCDIAFGPAELIWLASNGLGPDVSCGTLSSPTYSARSVLTEGSGGGRVYFTHAVFNRDGTMFASVSGRTITIWSSAPLHRLEQVAVSKEVVAFRLIGVPSNRLLVLFVDRTFEWFDISRSAIGTFDVREIVHAQLARGRSEVCSKDRGDSLLVEVRGDLRSDLEAQMSQGSLARAELLAQAEMRPLHRNCYHVHTQERPKSRWSRYSKTK